MAKQRLGMVGLGVMGQNLALNLASRGFAVAGFDLEQRQADAFAAKSAGQNVLTCRSQAEFLGQLERPRRILIMVPAGPDVDAVISTLRPRLERGDLLMDGGNTWFRDTVRRISELEGSGILYLGSRHQRRRGRRAPRPVHHAGRQPRCVAVGPTDPAGHGGQGRGRSALL